MNDDVMICFKPMSKHRTDKSGNVKTVSYSTNIPLDIDYHTARKIIDYFVKHPPLKNATVVSVTDDITSNRYCFTVKNIPSDAVIEETNISASSIDWHDD